MQAFCKQTAVRKLAAAAMLLALASTSHAAPLSVSLADLIARQGTIQEGDKLFSNFGYVTNSANFPTAGDIQVQGEVIGGNNGIGFVSGWHANPGEGLKAAKITYTVSTLAPDYYISDIHLDGDPSLIGGTGQSVVKLSASDLSHTSVLPSPGVLQIYGVSGSPSVVNAFANTVGLASNLRKLDVETTILQSADVANATASVLHIQQSFSQAPVPEPSSLALVSVGLLAVGTMSARRKSK